jgi:hypothetical protein
VGGMNEIVICLIFTVLVLGLGILMMKQYADEINSLCSKTNETIQTRYGKVNCLDWNNKNITAEL